MTVTRKKPTEVALPLKPINEATAREESIRHGHPQHAAPLVGWAAADGGASEGATMSGLRLGIPCQVRSDRRACRFRV